MPDTKITLRTYPQTTPQYAVTTAADESLIELIFFSVTDKALRNLPVGRSLESCVPSIEDYEF